MEGNQGNLESLIEKFKAYFITSLELTKLKLIRTVTTELSGLAFKLFLIVLISILTLILSISAGLWLGELLGKAYYGFFAVSGFYIALIAVVRLFLQNPIKRIINRSILKRLL